MKIAASYFIQTYIAFYTAYVCRSPFAREVTALVSVCLTNLSNCVPNILFQNHQFRHKRYYHTRITSSTIR